MSSRELDHEIERAWAVAAGVDVEEAPPERGPRYLMREVIRGRSSEVIRAVEGSPVGAWATLPNEGGHQRSSGATLPARRVRVRFGAATDEGVHQREVIRGHQGPRDLLVG